MGSDPTKKMQIGAHRPHSWPLTLDLPHAAQIKVLAEPPGRGNSIIAFGKFVVSTGALAAARSRYLLAHSRKSSTLAENCDRSARQPSESAHLKHTLAESYCPINALIKVQVEEISRTAHL